MKSGLPDAAMTLEAYMADNYKQTMFTPSVQEAQRRYYGKPQELPDVSGRDELTDAEREFIRERDSFFIATTTEDGWPYVQHRGGEPGFLHVLDEHTMAFADYRGNRQLLTTGNIAVNDRVSIFLIDYPRRERLKILGHARIEDARANVALAAQLADPGNRRLVERLFFIDVVSFEWNCSQHITPRYTVAEVESAIEPLRRRIAELEEQIMKGD
jgi:predicted pyridoxine 5'-phosphate oxidase superfamily flavin-nucleotide-binding protein